MVQIGQHFSIFKLKMFFLFIVLVSLATSEATFCSQSDEKTLFIYPSPKNCSVFHACIENEEYEFNCLKAPTFISWAAGPICSEPCHVTATTRKVLSKISKKLPLDLDLYPNETGRTIVCPPTGQTMAIVMESCNEFMECNEGKGTKKTCPQGQEFSRENYQCIDAKQSDCQKHKPKGFQHNTCRHNRGSAPIYMEADSCGEFKKCANQLAWNVPCARDCFWNDDEDFCDWATNVECSMSVESE